jgi:hypothetical protein
MRDTTAMTTGDPLFPIESQMRALTSELSDADFTPVSEEGREDHEAHAAGQVCPRCHRKIAATDDVRRKATGEWVHESC